MARPGGGRGATITIFLVDGTSEGLRVTTKASWTGACLDFARSDYARARERDEIENTGIYILVGPDPDSGVGRTRLYVGEGDSIRTRIDQHHANKDFWNRAYLFTTRDNSLNKAHVRYLEAKLIALAQGARTCAVENSTVPLARGLGEAERDQMEAFLDEMLVLLPLLGVQGFSVVEARPAPTAGPPTALPLTTVATGDDTSDTSGQTSYFLREKGRGVGAVPVSAEALDDPRGFIVLAGAVGPARDGALSPGYDRLRQRLRAEGLLVAEEPNQLRLVKDYPFESPSAAAAVIAGSNRRGPTVWKDVSQRTLAENRAGATATARLDGPTTK